MLTTGMVALLFMPASFLHFFLIFPKPVRLRPEPGGLHYQRRRRLWLAMLTAIYLIPALPIAYFYYVRHRDVLKVSEALLPVLGERHAHGKTGKIIDILFVFGMLGGAW